MNAKCCGAMDLECSAFGSLIPASCPRDYYLFTYSPVRFTYWGAVVVVVTVVVVDELVTGWLLTPPTFTTPGTLISPEGVVDSILTVYRT